MATIRLRLTPAAREEIRNAQRRGADAVGAIGRGMARGGLEIVGRILARKLGGNPLKVRTGALRGSVAARTVARGAAISTFVGVPENSPASRYAAIQEHGGVIKARPGRALAIPVGQALTPGGTPRYPGGPRTVPFKLTMIKPKGGAPLLVRDVKGRKARAEILFVLKRSVRIKPTHWLSSGVEENLDAFPAAINDELAKLA